MDILKRRSVLGVQQYEYWRTGAHASYPMSCPQPEIETFGKLVDVNEPVCMKITFHLLQLKCMGLIRHFLLRELYVLSPVQTGMGETGSSMP